MNSRIDRAVRRRSIIIVLLLIIIILMPITNHLSHATPEAAIRTCLLKKHLYIEAFTRKAQPEVIDKYYLIDSDRKNLTEDERIYQFDPPLSNSTSLYKVTEIDGAYYAQFFGKT